jgi:hypothetical protein
MGVLVCFGVYNKNDPVPFGLNVKIWTMRREKEGGWGLRSGTLFFCFPGPGPGPGPSSSLQTTAYQRISFS